jgi:hypothetical protein
MRSSHMNATAIRTGGRYLGAWGSIVIGVVLLSIIFTFLGTITCAVLVGMMMGAFKGSKWFSVAVSLVFPGVIIGMVRTARVELTQQQVILLAALCFGVFWVTYLVSAVLFFCEQKGKNSSKPPAPALQDKTAAPEAPAAAIVCVPAVDLGGSTVAASESCLKQLQGSWVCEVSGAGEPLCKKVIQIKEAKLELRTVDASGRATLVATGDVTLQGVRGF